MTLQRLPEKGFGNMSKNFQIAELLDLYGMLLGIVGTLAFIVFASIISLMRATGAG